MVPSTLPVTPKPRARWKSITAALVPPPKSPSTPPRTETPALTSAPCRARTRAPFSPNAAKPPDAWVPDEPGSVVTGFFGFASALAVVESTAPVASRPCEVWNCLTALAVAGPKIPSAPPRTVTPASISACCSVLTVLPSAPALSPDSDEPPDADAPDESALAVASSTWPLCATPACAWNCLTAASVARP